MSPLAPFPSRRAPVLAALAVVVALGALLGFRLVAGGRTPSAGPDRPVAPAATVPAPNALSLATLAVPCWGCPGAASWPVAFQTDLDLLAPLGNGPANAGLFFKDFARPNGSRYAEAVAAMERRVDDPGELEKVLPPDDPLLLEAEPWCDQATMRFHPDFFPLEGYGTALPNLLLTLTLAKSWVARGLAADDPARAMEDFRRAVRLGRLLRQEDATIITDLVGLACIRIGAQGVYDVARKSGEAPLALLASVVLGEHAPQRLLTSERVTKVSLAPFARRSPEGAPSLDLPDTQLDAIVALALSDPDRRFRSEGILTLSMVRALGTKPQQEKALATLKELATPGDALSSLAAWSLEHPPTKETIAEAFGAIEAR
jgi:hypothetical protein